MKEARFYIHQGPDCWQICSTSIANAVLTWRTKAIYPDGERISGRPDKIDIEIL